MALVYSNGKMHPSDIAKHVQTDSNFIAYHLNILIDANLLRKSYARHGNHLSEYVVTEDGTKFLDFIGATEKLNEISAEGNIQEQDESNPVRALSEQNINKIRSIRARRGSYGPGHKKYAKASRAKYNHLKKRTSSKKLKA